MKSLNVSQPLSGGTSASRFESARALAFSLALTDSELHEPEMVARHDYGVSHDGRLEVDVGGEVSFIFLDSSSFDSCAHFGPGPFINIRDAQGNEMICSIGGVDCVPLDGWTRKLT